jgi:hypothetical protein
MNIVSTVLAILLIVVCVGSGVMDIRKPERLVEQMKKLKVPADRLQLLGAIKIAAAMGLVVGLQNVRLGEITGVCLAMYFAIAVVTHTRVKDSVKDTLPAFMLCAMSFLYLLATVAK